MRRCISQRNKNSKDSLSYKTQNTNIPEEYKAGSGFCVWKTFVLQTACRIFLVVFSSSKPIGVPQRRAVVFFGLTISQLAVRGVLSRVSLEGPVGCSREVPRCVVICKCSVHKLGKLDLLLTVTAGCGRRVRCCPGCCWKVRSRVLLEVLCWVWSWVCL